MATANSTCKPLAKAMKEWNFSEPTLAGLPLDRETRNYVRRHVPNAVFSVCNPTPLTQPRKLVAYSDQVLKDVLDMEPETMTADDDFVDFVSGNKVLEGSIPMAHRYGGHQFGVWVRLTRPE